MTKIYTENDLLLHLYNELPENEANELEQALSKNPELLEKYQQLKGSIEMLDSLSEEPSPTSVSIVLEFAKKLAESELTQV